MIDQKVAERGVAALTAAISHLLEEAHRATTALPKDGFQQRKRLAGVIDAGRDVSTLALAAVVLLMRSRSELEHP